MAAIGSASSVQPGPTMKYIGLGYVQYKRKALQTQVVFNSVVYNVFVGLRTLKRKRLKEIFIISMLKNSFKRLFLVGQVIMAFDQRKH